MGTIVDGGSREKQGRRSSGALNGLTDQGTTRPAHNGCDDPLKSQHICVLESGRMCRWLGVGGSGSSPIDDLLTVGDDRVAWRL